VHDNSVHFLPKTPPVSVLPGSLHARFVRCGKVGCRCTTGLLHGPYWRLAWREDGRTRWRYVRRRDVPEVRRALVRWRQCHPSLRTLRRDLRDLRRILGGWGHDD